MKRRLALLICAASSIACSLTTDFASLSEGGPLGSVDAGADSGAEAGPGDAAFDAPADARFDGEAAVPCTARGQRCPDTTIFVVQRSGGTLYTTPCDVGQVLATTGCTGERQRQPYNNGNTGGGVFVGATSSDDGLSNTAKLVTADSDSDSSGVQPHLAAKSCADLVYGGHDDWYLPAIIELNELYLAKSVVGGFDESGTFYKSSTETHDAAEPFNAAMEMFSTGYQYSDGNSKSQPHPVRCIRYSP